MINRRTTTLAIVSAVLFAFCVPGIASAQYNRDDDYRRDRDRDYRRDRDRDYRRDRRDDDYYGNNSYRNLRDVADRLKNSSRNLERDVDRFLDRSRVNGTRREDRINNEVKEFRQAADRFRSRVSSNGNDRNRGYQEAQYLLQTANRTENMLSRLRVDSRTYADWREIKRDLRIVSNAYGLGYNDDGYYRNDNGRYDPRDDRNNRNGRNDDNWWRQLPGIINGRRP